MIVRVLFSFALLVVIGDLRAQAPKGWVEVKAADASALPALKFYAVGPQVYGMERETAGVNEQNSLWYVAKGIAHRVTKKGGGLLVPGGLIRLGDRALTYEVIPNAVRVWLLAEKEAVPLLDSSGKHFETSRGIAAAGDGSPYFALWDYVDPLPRLFRLEAETAVEVVLPKQSRSHRYAWVGGNLLVFVNSAAYVVDGQKVEAVLGADDKPVVPWFQGTLEVAGSYVRHYGGAFNEFFIWKDNRLRSIKLPEEFGPDEFFDFGTRQFISGSGLKGKLWYQFDGENLKPADPLKLKADETIHKVFVSRGRALFWTSSSEAWLLDGDKQWKLMLPKNFKGIGPVQLLAGSGSSCIALFGYAHAPVAGIVDAKGKVTAIEDEKGNSVTADWSFAGLAPDGVYITAGPKGATKPYFLAVP